MKRFLALVTAAMLLPAHVGANSEEDTESASSNSEADESPMELEPFRAEYRINVNRIPIGIGAELQLEPLEEDDRYHIEFRIDSWLMNNTESSTFAWRDCEPRTERYTHEFRGFGRRRNYEMDFDWGSPVEVTTISEERGEDTEEKTQEVPEDILDELTMLLMSRCLLDEGREEYVIDTIYGTRVREHEVAIVDEETLNTPMGEMETLVIKKQRDADSDRHTRFWVAPELDYMLIRARHQESPRLYGELRLRSYSGPL